MEPTVSTELIPLDKRELIDSALEFFGNIEEIKVSNEQEYENSLELCKIIKGKANELLATRKALVKPKKDEAKEIEAEFNDPINKLANAESKIKSAASIYYTEKERKRLLEVRKRQAVVDEKNRLEAERAEREQKKADEYREQGKEELADKAEARAEDHADQAINTVAAEVEETKISGVHFRTDYEVKVVDKLKAVNACMASPQFQNHVHIDTKALERVAKAFEGNLNLDGIEVIEKKTPVVRGK